MRRRFIQCDVFSDEALKGNGLAVVVDGDGLSDAQMQSFAVWTNQAETTFLLPPRAGAADYRVRIFSPKREMPFAGHPTLGSAAAWQHAGGVARDATRIIQECEIGLVEIDCTGAVPAFVAPQTEISQMDPDECARICDALGIGDQEVLAAVTLDNGVLRNLLEVKDATRVLALDAGAVSLPEFAGVSVMGRYPAGAVADYETRNLTPASLMVEDPVTGSMNAAIAVWLKAQGRLEQDVVIAQGSAMGRKGRVFVTRRGGDVLIGGQTTIVIKGSVEI